MFRDYTLQTTWGRALVALVVGAVVGTLGLMLLSLYNSWSIFGSSLLSPQNISRVFLALFPKLGIAVFAIFLPVGLTMYKFGFRTWISAALIGYLVPLIHDLVRLSAMPLYSNYVLETTWWQNHWAEFLSNILLSDILVVPVALTIWCIAYRRPAPC